MDGRMVRAEPYPPEGDYTLHCLWESGVCGGFVVEHTVLDCDPVRFDDEDSARDAIRATYEVPR